MNEYRLTKDDICNIKESLLSELRIQSDRYADILDKMLDFMCNDDHIVIDCNNETVRFERGF